MAFLQVYANGILLREIPLTEKVTTIGRSPQCDIRIDNPGISELHARIRFNHGHHIVEDAMSRNGLLLNDHRVDRKKLDYGDQLSLPKHNLVFVEHASGNGANQEVSRSFDAIPQDETVEVDIAYLQQKLQMTDIGNDARLLLQGATDMRQDYPINKVDFTIGKSCDSDLYLSALFAPARAASIQRRSDGYYILPSRRGKVRINGRPIRESHKLVHGDGLRVRNIRLSFRQQ
jgi:pSer/pThr/pTyr-binding forkhead associated (FHA) protein